MVVLKNNPFLHTIHTETLPNLYKKIHINPFLKQTYNLSRYSHR